MPLKGRWALNPRKWFGTASNCVQKTDNKHQIINYSTAKTTARTVASLATRPTSSKSTDPQLLITTNKIKAMPTSSTNDNNSTDALTLVTQLQLPAFSVRHEKSSAFSSSSSLFNKKNTLISTRTEPSIRKNGQLDQKLSIEAIRRHNETMASNTSKLLVSSSLVRSHENHSQQNSTKQHSELNISNISNQCLVDYPQNLSSNLIENCRSLARTCSSSSLGNNDDRDESVSSGIFTDERAEISDCQHTASKDTLSTLDIASIESIDDSQTPQILCQSQSLIYPYRLPMSTVEKNDKKPTRSQQQQHPKPINSSHRVHSAEDLLKDNQINTPMITKYRQSSAAIVKKIEKRISTSQSPNATLEKASFVRIANDTYRLTTEKDNHLYHRRHRNSIVQYSNHDDSLPPANDEESYAALPRTSSTEQLDTNLQNELRAIVDDYLRPIVTSINEVSDRSTKAYHRSKRLHTNNEHVQINIQDIVDKLSSSVNYSIYAPYQRYY